MDFETVKQYGFVVPVVFITILNIVFFRLFRTYEGVIRLSSAQEGVRCVSAVFWSFFALLTSVGLSAVMRLPHLVPTSVLIIYFFTASFLLFAYRIWAKALYHKSLKGKLIDDNVMIFGTTINGVFLKNAIESMTDRSYKVIGFIEGNKNLWGKSIDQAKFYSFEQVPGIAEKFTIKYLFVTADDPDVEMKTKIVDYCLANNIAVKVIPVIQKWINGHLQTTQLKNLKIEDLLSRPDIKLPAEHLQAFMAGKIILITGAAGSIGSEIVMQLARIKVKQLILCDNRETALHELQYDLQQITTDNNTIVLSVSDVRNRQVMQHLFENYKPEVVFHAAAYKHVPLMEMHPCQAITNNVLGTKIVADLSVQYGVERFVFISTDKAINPTNVMGASKRIAEMYIGKLQSGQRQIQKIIDQNSREAGKKDAFLIKKNNTKFIITRFGNVLGSNGSVIPRFQKQIDEGGPITVTHPDIIRYFMTIPEACSLVLEAGRMGNGGEIFVFDMGEPVKIVDLANKMIKLSGLTPGKEIQVQFTGLRPGEKLYEELLNVNEEVIPTHHEKIMISKVNKIGSGTIIKDVDDLITLARKNKDMVVVKHMKSIVLEYKSKNSAYENLDKVEGTSPAFLAELQG
ncbi:MAG: nucleoside-diphosphate sugar epimerase/dehydratase [Chitinophagaceae bacterium]